MKYGQCKKGPDRFRRVAEGGLHAGNLLHNPAGEYRVGGDCTGRLEYACGH